MVHSVKACGFGGWFVWVMSCTRYVSVRVSTWKSSTSHVVIFTSSVQQFFLPTEMERIW